MTQPWEVFDLAALLTLLLIHPQNVQVHTHVETSAPGAEDRMGAPAGTEGSAGPREGGFPLACLGNSGGLLSVIFMQFSQAIL